MEGGDLLTNQIDDKNDVVEMSYQNSRSNGSTAGDVSVHHSEDKNNTESYVNDSRDLNGNSESHKPENNINDTKEDYVKNNVDDRLSETSEKSSKQFHSSPTETDSKTEQNPSADTVHSASEETDGAVLSKFDDLPKEKSGQGSDDSNKNNDNKDEKQSNNIGPTGQQSDSPKTDEDSVSKNQDKNEEAINAEATEDKADEHVNQEQDVGTKAPKQDHSNTTHDEAECNYERKEAADHYESKGVEHPQSQDQADHNYPQVRSDDATESSNQDNVDDKSNKTADVSDKNETKDSESIASGISAETKSGHTKENILPGEHQDIYVSSEKGADHVDGDSEPIHTLNVETESTLKADEKPSDENQTNDDIKEADNTNNQIDTSYADDFEEERGVESNSAPSETQSPTSDNIQAKIDRTESGETIPPLSYSETENPEDIGDEIKDNSEMSDSVTQATHRDNEISMENESETLKSEVEKSTDDNARADEPPKQDTGDDTENEAEEIGSEEAADGKGGKIADEKDAMEEESKTGVNEEKEKGPEVTEENDLRDEHEKEVVQKPGSDEAHNEEKGGNQSQNEETTVLKTEGTESSKATKDTENQDVSGNDKEDSPNTEEPKPEPEPESEPEPEPIKIRRNVNIDDAVDTITGFEGGVTELVGNMKELLEYYHERLGKEPLANFVHDMGKFKGDFSSMKDAYKKCEEIFLQLNKSLKDLRHSGEAVSVLIDRKFRDEDLKMWMESEDALADDVAKIKEERIAAEKSAIARASEARGAVAKSAVSVTESNLYAAEVEAESAEAETTARRAWEAAEIALRVAEEAKKAAEEKRKAEEEARKRAEERAKQRAEVERKLREEEDKKIRDESERKGTPFEDEKRKAMEEKARKEAERKNPKNWPRFVVGELNIHHTPPGHSVEPGDFDPGVGCVIRAIEGSVQRDDVQVTRVDQFSRIMRLVENEELISNIIQIKPVDPEKKFTFDEPMSVAIPHCLQRNIPGREPVIKQLQPTSGRWSELPTADVSFEDIRELKFVEFRTRRFGVFAVVLRLKRDTLTFTRKGVKVNSTTDARVSFTCRPGMFKNNVNFTCELQQMEMSTVNDLNHRRPAECGRLLASSPILRFQIPNRKFAKPLVFTLPLPPSFSRQRRPQTASGGKKEKADSMEARPLTARPSMGYTSKEDDIEEEIHLIVREDRGVWTALPKTTLFQAKNKDIVTFEVAEPHDRFLLLRTKEGVPIPAVEKMAHCVEAAVLHRSMQLSLRQRSDDPNDVILTCTPSSRTERVLKKLAEEGYDDGPMPSKEIIVKEGQIMEVQFRGNIHCLSEDISMKMIYNTYIKSRLEFTVEEIDNFAQKSLHCYRGFAQVFTNVMVPKQLSATDKAKTPQKMPPEMIEDTILLTELLINIPKPEPEPPKPLKTAPIRVTAEGPDKEDLLQYVSSELGDEWKKLAQYLSLRNVRIQAILRQNNQNPDPKKIRYDMLVTWAKRVPRCMNKLEILAQALTACGRGDLAEELRDRDMEFRRRRALAYRDVYLRRAFVKVAQNPDAVYGWKNIAKHLGVTEEELVEIDQSKPSVQEKCFQSLQKWQSSNGDGATLPILSEKLKMCKYKQLAKDIETIG